MPQFLHDLAIAQTLEGLFEFFFFGQGRADLVEIPAFDQGKAVLNDFPALPQVDQPFDCHAGLHAVFALVQGLPGEIEAPVNAQPESILDHAIGFEPIEGAGRRGALGHLQQFFLGDIQRLLQRRMDFPGRSTQAQPRQNQSGFQQQQQFTSHESSIQ
ncbi:hypothetical protein D3C87_1613500 [compost metagenome]